VNKCVRRAITDSDAVRSHRVPNLKRLANLRRILGQQPQWLRSRLSQTRPAHLDRGVWRDESGAKHLVIIVLQIIVLQIIVLQKNGAR
jgi:hypothetical protein